MARLPSYKYSNPAPSHAPLAHHQGHLDDDTDNVLDDNILDCSDPSAMAPAASHHQRRSSFPHPQAGPMYSPRTGRILAFPPYSANSDPSQFFYEQEPQSYAHPDASQTQSFGHNGWQSHGTPESLTPTPVYESYPTYDTKDHTLTYGHDSSQQMYGGLPVEPGALFQSNTTLTASPQSVQDWASNSSNDHVDIQSVPKHLGLASPLFNPNPPLLRRDGIRKKNARFDIPAERTLRTIDQLITQTSDEQEIKELKQQKRLLRNRQAALDSRQRKKQHTERLEEEKKQTTTVLNELEEALSEMRLREHEWDQQRNSWQTTQQQYKQYIDELLMEKEETIRCHTLETAELRKKNAILTEQAQKLESTAMSAVPSSTGFSADFAEFDHLTMESSPWDSFSMVNDFTMETEPKQETSLMVLPKKEKTLSKDDDKSATSGLLLMLLLCGAWVASSNTPTTTALIPTMPEDVRVASAAVLDNIYKDAGLQSSQPALPHTQNTKKSSSRASSSKTTLSASEFAGLSGQPAHPSFHHHITAPTDQQHHDQAFALTPTQWNHLTSDPQLDGPGPSNTPPAPRRNLNEALSDMRKDKTGSSAAEVYTRSLMWDEVPVNVVRDFARMVAECNSGNTARLDNGEPMT